MGAQGWGSWEGGPVPGFISDVRGRCQSRRWYETGHPCHPAGRHHTYPKRPQGVVGSVGLIPAAPVHQTLQLDQEQLLGPGEARREEPQELEQSEASSGSGVGVALWTAWAEPQGPLGEHGAGACVWTVPIALAHCEAPAKGSSSLVC